MQRERAGATWHDLDLVVDAGDGSAWNPDTFSTRWSEVLKSRGLPHVRFHDLRHAHATFMLMQGVLPKVVSERLGHSSVGITLDVYSHVLPMMQTEAVRAFDELFGTTPGNPRVREWPTRGGPAVGLTHRRSGQRLGDRFSPDKRVAG